MFIRHRDGDLDIFADVGYVIEETNESGSSEGIVFFQLGRGCFLILRCVDIDLNTFERIGVAIYDADKYRQAELRRVERELREKQITLI